MDKHNVDNQTQQQLDAFIKEEEGNANDYVGALAKVIGLMAVGMSLFHLYAAYAIVPTQYLRLIHVGVVLFLVFLSFPIASKFKNRLMWWDVLLALFSIAIAYYALSGGDDFADRNTEPNQLDMLFGIGLILLI